MRYINPHYITLQMYAWSVRLASFISWVRFTAGRGR